MVETTVNIHVNTDELDDAIKKANRLADLLNEAGRIVDSLSGKSGQSEP